MPDDDGGVLKENNAGFRELENSSGNPYKATDFFEAVPPLPLKRMSCLVEAVKPWKVKQPEPAVATDFKLAVAHHALAPWVFPHKADNVSTLLLAEQPLEPFRRN